MTAFVALLRAVNLGSHKKVAMSDLLALASELGLKEPRTLLQTGNLVFRATAGGTRSLEEKLERAAAKRLDLETEIYVRRAAEWDEIVSGNPFRDAARDDPAHLVAMVFRQVVPSARVGALRAAISGPEQVAAQGRTLYISYPDGIGRSRLTPALIARHVGQPGTGRNWNTVLKISAALAWP